MASSELNLFGSYAANAFDSHKLHVPAMLHGTLKFDQLHTCRGNLGSNPSEETSLQEIVDKIDCQQDLSHFLASATAAVGTQKELAERQEAALEAASQDLLCSPDIIRYSV